MEVIEHPKSKLKRIMLAGTHLHRWQGRGRDGLARIIRGQGQIQLDPLHPAGRYHDLFFMARMLDYKVGQFEREAYSKRLVFESYGVHGHIWGALCAVSIEQFPLFHPQMRLELLGKYQRPRIEKLQSDHPGLLEQVEDHIRARGPSSGADLKEMGKAGPGVAFWKTNRLSSTVMEALWLLGRLGVASRGAQFRKTYDLMERCIPARHRIAPVLAEDEKARRAIDLKLQNMPLVPIGPITAKSKRKKTRNFNPAWFEPSEGEGDKESPVVLKLEGSSSGYVAPANWEIFSKARLDQHMRAIGPLDPLIWNRQLAKRLFDFEYLWEVYHKPGKRRWGYYVYPLLYQGELVGRLEAKFDKRTLALRFFNFQPEERYPEGSRTESALLAMMKRWATALDAKSVENDPSLRRMGLDESIELGQAPALHYGTLNQQNPVT